MTCPLCSGSLRVHVKPGDPSHARGLESLGIPAGLTPTSDYQVSRCTDCGFLATQYKVPEARTT